MQEVASFIRSEAEMLRRSFDSQRVRGFFASFWVSRHETWAWPAGLKGLASKPEPWAGHMMCGGTRSFSVGRSRALTFGK